MAEKKAGGKSESVEAATVAATPLAAAATVGTVVDYVIDPPLVFQTVPGSPGELQTQVRIVYSPTTIEASSFEVVLEAAQANSAGTLVNLVQTTSGSSTANNVWVGKLSVFPVSTNNIIVTVTTRRVKKRSVPVPAP